MAKMIHPTTVKELCQFCFVNKAINLILTQNDFGKCLPIVRQRLETENRIQKDDEHEDGCDNSPTNLPVKARAAIQHELNVVAKVLQSINPEDSD